MTTDDLLALLVDAASDHVRSCTDPAFVVDGRSCARVRCLACGTTLAARPA